MNQKKFYRDLKFGVLKPKIFIILFCLFFSSLAFAAAPDKTWKDARIPSGISGCTSFQGFSLSNDRTEDPLDVIISEDGHTIFTVNQDMQSNLKMILPRVVKPWLLLGWHTPGKSGGIFCKVLLICYQFSVLNFQDFGNLFLRAEQIDCIESSFVATSGFASID